MSRAAKRLIGKEREQVSKRAYKLRMEGKSNRHIGNMIGTSESQASILAREYARNNGLEAPRQYKKKTQALTQGVQVSYEVKGEMINAAGCGKCEVISEYENVFVCKNAQGTGVVRKSDLTCVSGFIYSLDAKNRARLH